MTDFILGNDVLDVDALDRSIKGVGAFDVGVLDRGVLGRCVDALDGIVVNRGVLERGVFDNGVLGGRGGDCEACLSGHHQVLDVLALEAV